MSHRTTFGATFAACVLGLLLAALPAWAGGQREQIEQRIRDLEAAIEKVDARMAEVAKEFKISDVSKSLLEDSGAPLLARELRDKYESMRAPLAAMDVELKALRAEYERLKGLGGAIDLWGWVDPKGGFSDEMKDILKRERAKKAEFDAKAAEVDKAVAADPDLKTYKTLAGLSTAVDKAYRSYIDKEMPGNLELKRLVIERGRLDRERLRLQGLLAGLAGLIVVWTNDVGWVHVGSKEAFDSPGPHSGETWGGLGREPLVHTAAFEGQQFKSIEQAIKSLGGALGTVEEKRTMVASPGTWYEGSLNGKKVMIGFEIIGDPAFKPFMPKPK